MQKQTSKTALLVMDIQNGIASRIGEGTNVLVQVQKAGVKTNHANGKPLLMEVLAI